mmetsp:Transcript_16428/g.49293  ORF Transcript_16428/g.49293 Transcript_16428/m.49293 type:complete len:222 (+) Transcript_16428:476-1141(+)
MVRKPEVQPVWLHYPSQPAQRAAHDHPTAGARLARSPGPRPADGAGTPRAPAVERPHHTSRALRHDASTHDGVRSRVGPTDCPADDSLRCDLRPHTPKPWEDRPTRFAQQLKAAWAREKRKRKRKRRRRRKTKRKTEQSRKRMRTSMRSLRAERALADSTRAVRACASTADHHQSRCWKRCCYSFVALPAAAAVYERAAPADRSSARPARAPREDGRDPPQ